MRLTASVLLTSMALGLCGKVLADFHQPPTSKLSWDREDQKRERRRQKNRKTLEQRGIKLREDYDKIRKLVDVTQDLHPREHRRLVEKHDAKVQREQRRYNDEDMAYWGRFLQNDDMSLPTRAPVSVPTASPTKAPVFMPLPDDPTASPVAQPTVAPVVLPTTSPVAPDTPTVSPIGTPTASPVDPVPDAPTVSPVSFPTVSPVASPTASPVATPTASPVDPVPDAPTVAPVVAPTASPVDPVPDAPTAAPVAAPVVTSSPTVAPVVPGEPTAAPVIVTDSPTTSPTRTRTSSPTGSPVDVPVPSPTPVPTVSPTTSPVATPTRSPVATPTVSPVATPTVSPTVSDTASPTVSPVAATPAPVSAPTGAPTVNRARQVILPVALFSGTEFEDPDSYQSKSLAWLEGSSLDPFSDDKIIQRYSLGCIYYATNNVSTTFTDILIAPGVVFPWNNERAWLTDTDECTWSNVLCDDTTGFITRMDFFGNFLSGEFPAEITYLKGSLNNLDLSDNPTFTRGETFNTWLGTLTNLERLRYEDTNFINANGIPTEIGNLKKLGFYQCSNIRYVGAISSLAFPADMTQLSYLEMELNTFNSPIPTELALVPNLQFLYARDSSLTGGLDFMQGMQSIRECWTDRNPGLTGNLPNFLGTLSTLGSFSVTRSGWTGPLPTELGLLVSSMRQMYFYNNQFTGMVPSEWSSLTDLQELELQNNLLTGQIPQSICFLKFTRGLNLEADCSICIPENCCSDCVA